MRLRVFQRGNLTASGMFSVQRRYGVKINGEQVSRRVAFTIFNSTDQIRAFLKEGDPKGKKTFLAFEKSFLPLCKASSLPEIRI